MILARAGAAVEVLVRNGNEAFVEKRIPLPRYLHPMPGVFVFAFVFVSVFVVIVFEYLDLPATGRGVNADHLPIATQFTERDGQFHQVKVEARLGILARRPE